MPANYSEVKEEVGLTSSAGSCEESGLALPLSRVRGAANNDDLSGGEGEAGMCLTRTRAGG